MIVTIKADGEEARIVLVDITDRMREFITAKPAPGDVSLVCKSWLKTYRGFSKDVRDLDNHTYYTKQHGLIEEISNRAGTRVLVASVEAEPTVHIGFICGDQGARVLHYATTKPGWQRGGLFRGMVDALWPDEAPLHYSHRTDFLERMINRSPKWRRRLQYNPYWRTA